MEQVTNKVSETAQNTVNIAKGVTDDVIQLKFYKNPVFIVFTLYVVIISGIYVTMNNTMKNSYVFSNKFRDSANPKIRLVALSTDFSIN